MPSSNDPSLFGQLLPRYIGPMGNRVSAVAGIPGDPLTYYAGAASGGIFKTTDNGVTWTSIFDEPATSHDGGKPPANLASIGALAVFVPNDFAPGRETVWAGTGESWIRGPISIGNGIYKSADGGESWTHMGLHKSGRFSKIVCHPTSPDIVWAGVVGNCYQPSPDRGVFKTTDGGKTWRRVLHTNDDSGCSDLIIDPSNPNTLYAGMWQFALHSWTRTSGGPGSGVYKSTDGGDTWTELTSGLPTGDTTPDGHPYPVGKISLGIAHSNPYVLYANIETGDGEPTWDFPHPANGQLWRSDDAGYSWTLISYNRNINARPAYYTRNTVSPDDENQVYFFGPSYVVTTDGGQTLDAQGYPEAPGVDHHMAWIDPTDANRIAVASDSGISISHNRGQTWFKVQLPIGQLYNVSVDQRVPYTVMGNTQDWQAVWGPSNTRTPYSEGQADLDPGRIPRSAFNAAGGGECGYTIPDTQNDDYLWSSGASDGPNGGALTLIDRGTGHWRIITPKPNQTTGTAPKDVDYRFHWHYPLCVSTHLDGDHPPTVYAGSQFIHATDDRGQSWRLISPDLTGHDDNYLQSSGGLTGDNLNVRMAYATSAIAESPVTPGLLWVGTNNQRLWKGEHRQDGSWAWTETPIHGLPAPGDTPPWGSISCIVPSAHDADKLYVAVDYHQQDFGEPYPESAATAPYIYRSTDAGTTWTLITDGIPHTIVSYVHWLAEDPERPGLLFAGTENALYLSFDDGNLWQPLPGLPPAPISGITIQQHMSDLVLSTFGRGFYIYDDITPLRQLHQAQGTAVHLFRQERPAYRFQYVVQPNFIAPKNDPTVGIDPQSNCPINFWLSEKRNDVTLEIEDCDGHTLRHIPIPNTVPGINRYWWDFTSDPTTTILLRTNPPNQKDTPYCPSGVRPYSDPVVGGSLTYIVPPGTYTIKLQVGDTIQHTPLTILIDPTTRSTEEDIQQQIALQRDVMKLLDTVALDINQIEYLAVQIEHTFTQATDFLVPILERLRAIQDHLMQRKLTGQGEDLARFPGGLVEQLVYLGTIVGTGDYRPTDSQSERYRELEAQVGEENSQLREEVEVIRREVNPALKAMQLNPLKTEAPLPEDVEMCDLFQTGPAF